MLPQCMGRALACYPGVTMGMKFHRSALASKTGLEKEEPPPLNGTICYLEANRPSHFEYGAHSEQTA